jgi:carboxylesterase
MHLATQQEMAGLIVMSPALLVRDWRIRFVPLLRHWLKFVPKDPDPKHADLTDPEAYKRFWSYDVHPVAGGYQVYLLQKLVRAELGRIHLPTLIIYATGDMSIHPQSGPTIYEHIASQDKEQFVLHNSGHGLVVDKECGVVFEKVYAWVVARQVAGQSFGSVR